jgi:hexosaminidase
MEGGTEAARQGHEVVMTPTEYCYFDYYQAMDDEPPAIGGFLPLEKVYAFEPIPEDLDPDLHKFILGGQGNVWTEYISTPEHAEYMTFPRLCAMAEVLWSPKSLRNLDGFLSRMAAHYNRLDRMGVHYRIPRIGGFDAVNLFIDSVRVAVTNPRPGTDIRYTLDGTDPTPGSRLFREPLLIRENSVLTARLLAGSRYLGPAKRGEFLKRAPVKAVNPGSVKRGLAFDYHEGAFSSIQELEKSVATGSGRINGFDLPSGVPAENYGVVYTGFFKVPATGVYTWILNSDDGSRLFIGDTLLIDNDGLHGAIEKSAKIALESGFHPIRVAFFQAGGGSAFDVRWSGPGFSARPVPAAALWSDR